MARDKYRQTNLQRTVSIKKIFNDTYGVSIQGLGLPKHINLFGGLFVHEGSLEHCREIKEAYTRIGYKRGKDDDERANN